MLVISVPTRYRPNSVLVCCAYLSDDLDLGVVECGKFPLKHLHRKLELIFAGKLRSSGVDSR